MDWLFQCPFSLFCPMLSSGESNLLCSTLVTEDPPIVSVFLCVVNTSFHPWHREKWYRKSSMGSLSTWRHKEFGFLLMCSDNFGLRSQQRLDYSVCWPRIISELTGRSFTTDCGQVNVNVSWQVMTFDGLLPGIIIIIFLRPVIKIIDKVDLYNFAGPFTIIITER